MCLSHPDADVLDGPEAISCMIAHSCLAACAWERPYRHPHPARQARRHLNTLCFHRWVLVILQGSHLSVFTSCPVKGKSTEVFRDAVSDWPSSEKIYRRETGKNSPRPSISHQNAEACGRHRSPLFRVQSLATRDLKACWTEKAKAPCTAVQLRAF